MGQLQKFNTENEDPYETDISQVEWWYYLTKWLWNIETIFIAFWISIFGPLKKKDWNSVEKSLWSALSIMTIRVVEFSNGGYKISKIFA